MTSEVQICNMALAHVGAEALIAALDPDESEEARYCALYYETVRDDTLRAHPWNFATRFETLADLGSPEANWSYRYQYPADCLRALEIVKATDSDPNIDFEVVSDGASSRVILTNKDVAELRYTAGVNDPNSFDAGFIHTLSWSIAYHIAEPITGSSRKRGDAFNVYAKLLQSVRATDSGEGKSDSNRDASWIAARS